MQVFTTGILVSATKKDELPWNETSKLPLGVVLLFFRGERSIEKGKDH
jgi:hypothetical protein